MGIELIQGRHPLRRR